MPKVTLRIKKGPRLVGPKGESVQIPSHLKKEILSHPVETQLEVLTTHALGWTPAWEFQLVRVLNPGGIVERIEKSFREGEKRGSASLLSALLALKADYFGMDPDLLAWRVKLKLEQNDPGAREDCAALLAHPFRPKIKSTPPGLLDLMRSFSLEDRNKLEPALLTFLSAGRYGYESWDIRQLFDLIEIARWPLGYLTSRLKTGGDETELRLWLQEADRRRAEGALETRALERLEEASTNARGRLNKPAQAAPSRSFHRVIGRALRDCPPHLRPPGPFHLGAPTPRIGGETVGPLMLFCAKQALPSILPKFRTQAEEALALIAAGDQRAAITRSAGWRSADLGFFRRAASISQHPQTISNSVRNQVGELVRFIADRAPDRVTQLILDIDAELMRLEYVDCLKRSAPPVPHEAWAAHVRVVFRSIDNKMRPEAHIVRLREHFGLLAHIKGSFRFLEGSADDILASVPDAWFERAVEAMMS